MEQAESPEQRLMAAVLKQALDDLRLVRGYHGKTRLSEVEGWFSDHERGWLLSFENVCGGLGFDVDAIRELFLP
jgi:hypothetical protein